MIRTLFLGDRENIGQPTIPQEEANESVIVKPTLNALNLSTFSVSEIIQAPINVNSENSQMISQKIDILFYNKVSSSGSVLSSIVYLGEPRDSWSKEGITYKPKKLYYNNIVESAMNLETNIDFSYFNYIRYPGESTPCFLGIINENFKTDELPSNVEYGNTVVLDGWYTLVSAGVLVNPADQLVHVTKGAFVKRNPDLTKGLINPIEIAITHQSPRQDTDAHWHPYAIYDNKYNIAFYVDPKFRDKEFDWFPPFIRQDFFVLPRYNNTYEKSLKEYIDIQELSNTYEALKSKYRMISHWAGEKDFKLAQWYLQSTNLTIITENWI